MVMAQALVQQLVQLHPGVHVDIVAPPWSLGLLARMPGVHEAHVLPVAHGELGLQQRRALGRALRGRYRRAIVLPNSFKSALLPWFAGIPQRSGWRGEWRYGLLNDLRILDPAALPRMVQRFVALAAPAGTALPDPMPEPILRGDASAGAQLATALGIDPAGPVIALCPGAEFGPAKRWPAQHYAALAQRCIARGWQVMLMGSARDAAVTAAITDAVAMPSACHDLAGATTLEQAIDLMALASAVVSNDSGLMHVAAALQRPLLALFGPTSPTFTPPLSASAQSMQQDLPCAPCHQRQCPLGHQHCLTTLSPELVGARLDALLQAA